MSTILVIDDEPQIRRLLRVVFEAQKYKVNESVSGNDGLVEAASRPPDLIILDLGLPDMSGFEVLKRLREWTQTPILILSVQDSGDDKALALDEGADDYVTKPFDTAELLARVRVHLRRSLTSNEAVIECGPLKMDLAARLAWVHGKEISLTPTEYSLLRVLTQNVGKIVTHKHLLATVWGPNSVEQSQYLRVYLSYIRKKLSEKGFPAEAVCNEAGIGYRLLEPESL